MPRWEPVLWIQLVAHLLRSLVTSVLNDGKALVGEILVPFLFSSVPIHCIMSKTVIELDSAWISCGF